MANRKISLANELEELASALTTARLLAEELSNEQLATIEDTRIAPKAIAAVVNLAIARMSLLTRALRGSINPGIVSEPYNQALAVADNEEVILVEWDSKRRPASG